MGVLGPNPTEAANDVVIFITDVTPSQGQVEIECEITNENQRVPIRVLVKFTEDVQGQSQQVTYEVPAGSSKKKRATFTTSNTSDVDASVCALFQEAVYA